ncbi:hypothetical protein NECID01_1350 [Nematocida sp. AWRm77]|nr:hypothetical protein NECID01_1350 [Nematocida sp. AWRm77]
MRTIEEVGNIIKDMDKKYDSNFGYWVRGEENIDTIVINLKKYFNQYSEENFAEVLKWITEKWRVDSKVAFLIKLLHGPILAATALPLEEDAKRNLNILHLTVAGWSPSEIADIASAFMKDMVKEHRGPFLQELLHGCTYEHITEVFIRIDHLVEWSTKISILKNTDYKDPLMTKRK